MLFSAAWRCAWRRVRPVLQQNPLLPFAVLALCVVIPVAAAVGGLHLDESYAELARDRVVLRSLALGIGATGLVGGAAVALLAPGLAQLGAALEAAPVSRAAAAWSLTIAPACVGGVVLLTPLLVFAVAMAGEDGVVIAVATAAALVLGAAPARGFGSASGSTHAVSRSQARPPASGPSAGQRWGPAGTSGLP